MCRGIVGCLETPVSMHCCKIFKPIAGGIPDPAPQLPGKAADIIWTVENGFIMASFMASCTEVLMLHHPQYAHCKPQMRASTPDSKRRGQQGIGLAAVYFIHPEFAVKNQLPSAI